jgi:hypothetical protein
MYIRLIALGVGAAGLSGSQQLPEHVEAVAHVIGFRDQAVFASFSGVVTATPKGGDYYSVSSDAGSLLQVRSISTEIRIETSERKLQSIRGAASDYLPEGEFPGDTRTINHVTPALFAAYLLASTKDLDMENVGNVLDNQKYETGFWKKYPELKLRGYNHDTYKVAMQERIEDIIADRLRLRHDSKMIVGGRADSVRLYNSIAPEEGSYVDLLATNIDEPSECTKIASFWSRVNTLGLNTSQIGAVVKRFAYDKDIKDVASLTQKVEDGCAAIEKARISYVYSNKTFSEGPGPLFTAPFFRARYMGPRMPSVGGGDFSKNPYVARLQKIEAEIAEAYLLTPPMDEADKALQQRRAGLAFRRAINEEVGRQVAEGFELASDIQATKQAYNEGRIDPDGEWIVRSVFVQPGDLVQPNQHVLTWRKRDYAELAVELDGEQFRRISVAERLKPLSMYVTADPACSGPKSLSMEGEILTFQRLAGGRVKATIAVTSSKPGDWLCYSGAQQSLGSLPRNEDLKIGFLL